MMTSLYDWMRPNQCEDRMNISLCAYLKKWDEAITITRYHSLDIKVSTVNRDSKETSDLNKEWCNKIHIDYIIIDLQWNVKLRAAFSQISNQSFSTYL